MSDPRFIVPKVPSELERTGIVQHFCSLDSTARVKTKYFDISLSGRPTLSVKVGDDDILVEASTQSFFHTLAKEDGLAPGIPTVYDAFYGKGYHFLAMEKIDTPTVASLDDAVQRVTSALEWLFAQKSNLPSTLFGRIAAQEARVWHTFFKDHEAPLPFVNAEAVNKYINKALSRCPGKNKRSISLPDELSIYHAAIKKDNFLVDGNGRIWIIDFKYIGLFPKVFQQCAFFSIDSFASAVGNELGYKLSDFGEEMSIAAILINQSGDESLGLDKYGEPIRRPRSNRQAARDTV